MTGGRLEGDLIQRQVRLVELSLGGLIQSSKDGSMINIEDLQLVHELAAEAADLFSLQRTKLIQSSHDATAESPALN